MIQVFRDLLAKTTFQIVTIYGDPIGRIADNNNKYFYQHEFRTAKTPFAFEKTAVNCGN